MPLPRSPTESSPVIVHSAPLPSTVTVPVALAASAMAEKPPVLSVPLPPISTVPVTPADWPTVRSVVASTMPALPMVSPPDRLLATTR